MLELDSFPHVREVRRIATAERGDGSLQACFHYPTGLGPAPGADRSGDHGIGCRALVVHTVAYDRHGGFIGKNIAIAPDQLVEQSLDTTIVKRSPSARIYTTVGNGTTSLVFRYGELADTMQVTVRQAVQSLTMVSANCYGGLAVPLSVGQQVQLSIGAPARDRNGYVVADPVLCYFDVN